MLDFYPQIKLCEVYNNPKVYAYKIHYKSLFLHMYKTIIGTELELKDLNKLLLEMAKQTQPKERGDIFTYKLNSKFVGIFEKNYNLNITCLSIQRIINYEENQNTQY